MDSMPIMAMYLPGFVGLLAGFEHVPAVMGFVKRKINIPAIPGLHRAHG